MRRGLAMFMIAAGLLAAGACRGGDDDQPAPDPAGLLTAAADEMAGVQTVRMQLEADGVEVMGLPLTAVDGVVTREGDAQGTAQVEQLGQQIELRFVILDDTFHYQLVGAWTSAPMSEVLYDPSVILDPDRGLANLLRTATDPQLVGEDDGQYEVDATFSGQALAQVLPGFTTDTRGKVWIGVDRPLLHRAEIDTMTVSLSEFDQPVTIVEP
jgi:lipoprotein LprG